MEAPYRWQAECLERWKENGRRGILEVATDAGKTFFASLAMMDAASAVPDVDFMVVVPRICIMRQWRRSLLEQTSFGEADLGLRYSGAKAPLSKRILIYVVDTARYTLSKDVLAKQAAGRSVMLVCDEYHHLASKENNLVFEFASSPLFDRRRYFSLGLTATASDIPLEEMIIPALGPLVYSYSIGEALKDEVVSPYASFSIGVSLSAKEAERYDRLSLEIAVAAKALEKVLPQALAAPGLALKEKISLAMRRGDAAARGAATRLDRLVRRRRALLVLAGERVEAALALLDAVWRDGRTAILFAERISQCREIAKGGGRASRSTTAGGGARRGPGR